MPGKLPHAIFVNRPPLFMAKPNPTHPIAWFLVRLLAGLKRGATRLCPNLWLQLVLWVFGLITHLVPWLVIRIVTLWIIVPGDFSPALNRLLWGLPVYGFWYGLSTYWVREYCMIWVPVAWLILVVLGGLQTLGHTQLRQRLRIHFRLPTAVSASLGGVSLLVLAFSAAALIYVSPIEFLRGNAPDFSNLTPAELAERLTAEEQKLSVVLDGLQRVNAEAEPASAAQTLTKTGVAADESQLRREALLLRYHTALRRLAWNYQNHARLGDESGRIRAQALQSAASKAALDTTQRWNPRLDLATKTELSLPLADHEPRHGEALLTSKWVEKLRPFLQPGDILITRTNGYLATGFLPGAWSQLALYVGSAEQLQAAALDQDMRIQRQLTTFTSPDASGHLLAVITARGEGVVFSSLERVIGSADSIAVLRPKLTPNQKLEVISRTFAQVGKAYDFEFAFAHDDKLMCSELVARVLNGFVDFPLDMLDGQPLFTGDGLVRFWASGEGGPLLEFVAYVHGDEATGDCNWASPGDLAGSTEPPANVP